MITTTRPVIYKLFFKTNEENLLLYTDSIVLTLLNLKMILDLGIESELARTMCEGE